MPTASAAENQLVLDIRESVNMLNIKCLFRRVHMNIIIVIEKVFCLLFCFNINKPKRGQFKYRSTTILYFKYGIRPPT